MLARAANFELIHVPYQGGALTVQDLLGGQIASAILPFDIPRSRQELIVHHCYEDILSRIAEEPVWFDEHAVPRYCAFTPEKVANIYADEVALVEVTCQGCRRAFRVALSASAPATLSEWPAGPIGIKIREKTLHYGDPPNVWCCQAGPGMNSEPRRVIEYWRRRDPKYDRIEGVRPRNSKAYHTWTRHPSFEIEIRPDWVNP